MERGGHKPFLILLPGNMTSESSQPSDQLSTCAAPQRVAHASGSITLPGPPVQRQHMVRHFANTASKSLGSAAQVPCSPLSDHQESPKLKVQLPAMPAPRPLPALRASERGKVIASTLASQPSETVSNSMSSCCYFFIE